MVLIACIGEGSVVLIAYIGERSRLVTHSSILAWRIPWIEEPGGL